MSAVQNTYNAGKNTAIPGRTVQDLTSVEGRQQAEKDYDAILAELRKTYAEPEAMRRFDEIMRADGFERIEYSGGKVPFTANHPYITEGLPGFPITINPMEYSDSINKLTPDRSNTNMILHSSIATVLQDGGTAAVAAESWAIYGADRPYSDEMREAWKSRYHDAVQSQVDFDVNAFMGSGNPWHAQSSAVAVNTDIAAMAADIIAENDIDLGGRGALAFHLDSEGNMIVDSDVELTELFNKYGDFVQAVKMQMANPPMEAPAGSYADGDRSVEFSVNRSIVFRPDEPSAAVMIDNLAVRGSGYTYMKKAGEYFDPDAGSYSVGSPVTIYDIVTKDKKQYAQELAQHHSAMKEALSGVVKSGERFEGEVPYAEVEKAKAESLAAWEEYQDHQPQMYDARPEGGDPGAAGNLTGADASKEPEKVFLHAQVKACGANRKHAFPRHELWLWGASPSDRAIQGAGSPTYYLKRHKRV